MTTKIRINTFDPENPDETEATRVIDHDEPATRKWMSNHLFWAIKSRKGVEIIPEDEK